MPDVFAGRFELIDPVGSGGTGTVWRAWDRRLERYCAAKVLRQRHAGALLRFVREQALRLDHPNVLSPYSWAADDDQALLAMDLVGGGSLSSLIADFGPLPERYAAELLNQLLSALDQVHIAGLVHRDVKPANLLLVATGIAAPVIRLSDFGIALSLGEPRLTRHGTVVGTPGYVAPEVLAGALPSVAQDLYAAGVTGWQLVTGEEPPAAGPVPPRRPESASSAVWDVVEGLLQPDPDRRTRSAAAALKTLDSALAEPLQLPAYTLDGEVIEVFDQLPPLPSDYQPPRRRRPVLLAAGSTALVVVGTVIAVLLSGGPDGGSPPSGPPRSLAPTAPTSPISSAPTTVSTGAAKPEPDPAVKVSGPCGWQEAGSLATAADGTRVECRQQGSAYHWVRAG